MPFPLINGKTYDYSSIQIVLPNGIVQDISEISYSDSIEHGEFRGTAPHVLSHTNGQYSAEASFVIEKQNHIAFLAALALAAIPEQGRIHAVRFPVSVAYANGTMPIIKDTLVDCAIAGSENGHSSGTDALVVTVNLAVKLIKWNGISQLGSDAPFASVSF